MNNDRLQSQRVEMKYLVTEDVAVGIRDFVSSHLELDSNCRGKPDNSYHNHSVYLDSEDLRCYWDVINGNINRFKLRMRFYTEDSSEPVFFEIKRRANEAILKQRGPVRREAVAGLLAGVTPQSNHLCDDNPKYLAALQRFNQLMLSNAAAPKTHVCYLREAWVSPTDNSVRVTLDREVCISPKFSPEISIKMENPVMPWGREVILELKFTGRFPNWFGELARVFGIMRCGVAKYAEGVTALGPSSFSSSCITRHQQALADDFINARRRGRSRTTSEATLT